MLSGCLAVLVVVLAHLSACALWDESSPAGEASRPGATRRDGPEDGDPGALVPAGVQTVIDVDMAQLRRSPWVTPALEARDQRVRAAKADALGYDDISDVDRVIYAVTAAGADAPTLVIAQGRLQPSRVEDAFRVRWPGAGVDRWRGIAVSSRGENAIAFLTPRTFVAGAPASVRAVIDRAFGVGTDVGADPALGPTRRALCPEGPASARPAVLAAVAVDDRLRARVGDAAPVPPQLRQIGLRLDAGHDLDLKALGFLDNRDAAVALAERLNELLTDPTTRLTLRAMGLGMLLGGTRVIAEGARVLARVSVGEEHRPQLAAMLKTVIESSRAGAAAGGFGSW